MTSGWSWLLKDSPFIPQKAAGWGGDAKPARVGHPKTFFGTKARTPAILIRAWRGAGERENRSSKQQRVRKVVDPLNLDRGARVGHLHDQDRPIDEQNQQHNPGTEISCRHPRLLGQQNARTSNEKNCARQIANDQAPRNPRGHQFFERDSGASRWVQKVLSAKKYSSDRDQHAAHGNELAFALRAHRVSGKNPASARK